jgi:chemotaxis protein MotB
MAGPGGDIIIKKVKKVAGGHHGGAWKVAYADFVTAMMAFFLLLWLLATTSPQTQQGLAEYFTPTFGVQGAKGVGVEGGLSPNPEGKKQSNLSDPGIVVGRVSQGPDAAAPTKKLDNTPASDQTGKDVVAFAASDNPDLEKQDVTGDKGSKDADSEEFKRVEQELLNAFENTPELQEFKDNIVITQTPEGLKIDMADDQERPMFAPGSAMITEAGKTVMKAVQQVVATTDSKVSVSGHTDATFFGAGTNFTNWELSADRANSSRRFLVQVGMEPERVAKVQGLAGTDLLVPNEPTSPRNRRISLILIRGAHMEKNRDVKAVSKGLLTVPDVTNRPVEEPAAP